MLNNYNGYDYEGSTDRLPLIVARYIKDARIVYKYFAEACGVDFVPSKVVRVKGYKREYDKDNIVYEQIEIIKNYGYKNLEMYRAAFIGLEVDSDY